MNKFIRWQGLIAFVVIIGGIVGGTYFFANPLIKSLIESQGANIAGAKVDVGQVQLGLLPAGMVIQRLDIADADNPMTNVVSIKTISLQFDLLKALMGQAIIRDASVLGMEFGTERKTSGALPKKPKKDKVKKEEPSFVSEQLSALASEFPDAKELLEREPLLMDERHKALERSSEEKQATWRALESKIPNSDKIASYQERLKALQNSKVKSLDDFNKIKKEFQQIQDEIKQDKKTIEQAKQFVSEASKELSQQLRDLKNAPKEDIDRLMNKYSLDEAGLVNLSGLLFGDEIQGYFALALEWYEKLAPYLVSEDKEEEVKPQRTEGRFVHFPSQNPYPDFLIEKMAASATLPLGEISATAKEITHQQHVRNRPTTLHVMSELLRDVKRLDVNAEFDYRKKKQGLSKADFMLDDVTLNDFKVIKSGDFPLTLAKANTDINGQIRLQEGRLAGEMHGDFTHASFISGEHKGLMGLLSQAFTEINQFDLDIEASGSLKKPKLNIKSNIDSKLKHSIDKQIKAQIAAFKADIEKQLTAKLDQQLQKLDINGFADEELSLQQKLSNLDDLLKAKLDDYKDQQTQELKDKSKDKLKDELKKLKF